VREKATDKMKLQKSKLFIQISNWFYDKKDSITNFYYRVLWKKFLLILIPIILSVIGFILLVFSLLNKLNSECNFYEILLSTRTDIISISGFLSGIIIAYLATKVLQTRTEKITNLPELNELTQKVHKFRKIMNLLVNSDIWVDGLKEFLRNNYSSLTIYEVRKSSYGEGKPTKLKIIFNQDEKNTFGDTLYLYLELKSFIFDEYSYDETLYSESEVPIYYSSQILKKWIKYDCGGNLWYFFDNKLDAFAADLKISKVTPHNKTKIEECTLLIDRDKFNDIKFGPKLLAKLGTHFREDIFPKLLKLQLNNEKGLPAIAKYLCIILYLLLSLGVALPLISKIYSLPPIVDIISVSFLF
jgi:hypothetical protein